jgi:hypothetical protein
LLAIAYATRNFVIPDGEADPEPMPVADAAGCLAQNGQPNRNHAHTHRHHTAKMGDVCKSRHCSIWVDDERLGNCSQSAPFAGVITLASFLRCARCANPTNKKTGLSPGLSIPLKRLRCQYIRGHREFPDFFSIARAWLTKR